MAATTTRASGLEKAVRLVPSTTIASARRSSPAEITPQLRDLGGGAELGVTSGKRIVPSYTGRVGMLSISAAEGRGFQILLTASCSESELLGGAERVCGCDLDVGFDSRSLPVRFRDRISHLYPRNADGELIINSVHSAHVTTA